MNCNEMECNQLKAAIKDHYNLPVTDITMAPRGFAAETFFVYTENNSYFLKIMKRPARQSLFKNGLRAVDSLVEAGIDFIPPIIHTINNDLYIELDNGIAALYAKLDGKQTYEFDRRDAFQKLARIYHASAQFSDKDTFLKETFGDWFIKPYEGTVIAFLDGGADAASFNNIDVITALDNPRMINAEAQAAKVMLMPYAESLKALIYEAKAAVGKCRGEKAPFYLTHSDFPGNVMVTASGEQYLIDFDESMFGPLERDGWMSIVRENDDSVIWTEVMNVYFPGYTPNENFIRYYVYQRFMVDLIDFIKDFLYNPDKEYREKILRSTDEYLLGWLYPILQKYSR